MNRSNRKMKNSCLSLLLLVSCFFLTGCWSGTEVDDLAIIHVMGIDMDKAGNYALTVRVIKPQELYSSTSNKGGTGENYHPIVETGKGKSIFQALSNLSEKVSNRIYLGHVLIVVLGDDVARHHLHEAMDFLTRENHFRPNIQLLVTQGDAQSILKVKPRGETTLGAELNSFIKNAKYHPTSMVQNVMKFKDATLSQNKDSYTGVINLEKNKSAANQKSKNTSGDDEIQGKLAFDGTAIFKGEGLVGYLNHRETEGFLMMQGNLAKEVVVLPCPFGDQGTISLKISDNQSRITPELENGKVNVKVKVNINSDIREMTCHKSSQLTTQELNHLNHVFQKKVLSDMSQTLKKVKRDYQADVLGFGQAIYKKYPKEWKTLAPHWSQEKLRDLKVDLEVNSNISNYGLVREYKN